jgi:flavin reductase (DIM6/NTAB) family NADH-FMN oxidoreductase RutF
VLEDRQAVDGFSGDRTEMKNLPLSKVYQLLEPGPVVLLTTTRKDHANIMAMSWHMMVDFEPPLVACIVTLLSKIAFSAN